MITDTFTRCAVHSDSTHEHMKSIARFTLNAASTTTFSCFRHKLKTFLFTEAHRPVWLASSVVSDSFATYGTLHALLCIAYRKLQSTEIEHVSICADCCVCGKYRSLNVIYTNVTVQL